jgi:SAM-dependent methyltransferase
MNENDPKRDLLRGYQVIAEYYDAIPLYANRADIDFYVKCGKQAAGPILELGCGTGRILIPTAAAGCEIAGLDISEAMLNRCREKLAGQPKEVHERARLVQGSMVKFDVGGEFKLVKSRRAACGRRIGTWQRTVDWCWMSFIPTRGCCMTRPS